MRSLASGALQAEWAQAEFFNTEVRAFGKHRVGVVVVFGGAKAEVPIAVELEAAALGVVGVVVVGNVMTGEVEPGGAWIVARVAGTATADLKVVHSRDPKEPPCRVSRAGLVRDLAGLVRAGGPGPPSRLAEAWAGRHPKEDRLWDHLWAVHPSLGSLDPSHCRGPNHLQS